MYSSRPQMVNATANLNLDFCNGIIFYWQVTVEGVFYQKAFVYSITATTDS